MMDYILPILGILVILSVIYPRIMVKMDQNITNVSGAEAAEVAANNKDLVIIDVRTQGEYQTGHIAGAKNIPVGELSSRLKELEKYRGKPLLVHCASGSRSSKAVRILSKNNFSPVYHLNHGLHSWQGALKK